MEAVLPGGQAEGEKSRLDIGSVLATVGHAMPTVVLATVLVPVWVDGREFVVRALLDTGSSASFITERAVRKLKLVRRNCSIRVNSVGADKSQGVNGCVNLSLCHKSEGSCNFIDVNALIMDKVVGDLPPTKITNINMPNIVTRLADPLWNIPGPVDLLLGADVYYQIVTAGAETVKGTSYISTIFGFAISGLIESASTRHLCVSALYSTVEMDLERFWKLEEVPDVCDSKGEQTDGVRLALCRSTEEKFAEDNFFKTHQFDSSGRIVATLPFIGDVGKLGNSERIAKLRFLNNEKKLERSPLAYAQYRKEMNETLSLGHMEKVPIAELNVPSSKVYYIPHHGVFKEGSTTTKLRIVLDASCPTSTGVSLNDLLANGPKIQDDLFHILIRFRLRIVAVVGDVAKMYRQIALDNAGKDYHRLFWRNTSSEPLEVYRMTRVTYGVKSAGHTSIRSLQVIAAKFGNAATQKAMNDFYVDDLLSGDDTINLAGSLIKNITESLVHGGFELRKLASSEPSLINALPEKLRENIEAFEFSDEDHLIKTLGLEWQPVSDVFSFKVCHLDSDPISSKDVKRGDRAKLKAEIVEENSKVEGGMFIPFTCPTAELLTRRKILSDIAKIFDPLGFLSCVVIVLKICMQEIWKTKLGWDEELPTEITAPYLEWRDSLTLLRDVKVPRRVIDYTQGVHELHVFCDASEKAYGAVVYVRETFGNHVTVKFLTSKARVAPLKHTTIPKLELCAALTGMKLIQAVLHSLRFLSIRPTVCAWSDSTTVLHWLDNLPGKWQTFVANRVAQIQEVIPREKWFHVPTEVNPADLASRGVPVAQFIQSSLWWQGPEFLRCLEPSYPPQPSEDELCKSSLEEKKIFVEACASLPALEVPLASVLHVLKLDNFSTLEKAVRVLVRVKRFIATLRDGRMGSARRNGRDIITSTDRRDSLRELTIASQQVDFSVELACILRGEQLVRSNRLAKLYPFLDPDDGVLRVGGRLQARVGTLANSTIYPAILTRKCRLSVLLGQKVHEETLHGGLQLCIAELRRTFWVISSRQMFRDLIRNCVTCFRHNSKPLHALMGDLPKERVTPSRPFSYVGLDFAGPIAAKAKNGTEKVYLAIFVCFSTKAVHIEVVSSLTSQGCIAALHRFTARRGLPVCIYSDNGTNFTGARGELNKLRELLHIKSGKLAQEVGKGGMEWVFIPPGSPNFGGLWEAAVKSAKGHMKKVVGKAVLTFEELCTLCCDIEAMLNSRPLIPVSDDPNDLGALTPFMFLTGSQSYSLPLLSFQKLPSDDLLRANETKRWLHVKNMMADFWKRWSREYLTTLQQRPKHVLETPNLKVNDMVLLTSENLPPLQWPLGRILEVFPGNDGYVRTVLVKTAAGTYKRPAYKARKLPFEAS